MDTTSAYVHLALDEQRLLDERSAILRELGSDDGEVHDMPGESADEIDEAALTFERERDSGLLAEIDLALAEIARARARVEAGTYGRCVDCGADIGDERLEALPATRTCIEHARQSERRQHGPVI